ncbi:MAG TPA: phage major capsid protein [Actinokineospora sp.]|jgi:HK97 family phage major capsid protein/HK97 family phage prohead protease|nr:phage major capsid protein [Actinokineospora sp.]
MHTTERRDFATAVEVRAKADGTGKTIRGYAYVFNRLSLDLGGFRERIEAGAGREDMERGELLATFNHDFGSPLGRTGYGLRTGVDDTGGWYEIDLPDTTAGRDVAELVDKGIVRGSSFMFILRDVRADQEWTRDPETGDLIRTVKDFRVRELGPVTNPAYPDTTVAKRSIPAALANPAKGDTTVTASVTEGTTTAEQRAHAENALQRAADEGRSELERLILARLDAIDARFDAELGEARATETRDALLAALDERANRGPVGAEADDNATLRALGEGDSAEFRAVLGVGIDVDNKQGGKTAARPSLYSELLKVIQERSSIIAAGARVIRTTGGGAIDFPRVVPKAHRGKTAEGNALPENYPATDLVPLDVAKTGYVSHISAELVEDDLVDLIGFLVADAGPNLADTMGVDFVAALLSTTTGILPALRKTIAAAPAADNGYTDAVIDVHYSIPEFYAARARWIMGRLTLARARKWKDADGRYLLKSVADGGALTLMDRPVSVDPGFGATNEGKIAFTDLGGFTVRFAGPLRVARSTEVKFLEDLVSYKFVQRYGGALIDTSGSALLTLPAA